MKDNPVEKSGNPLSVSVVSRSIDSLQIVQPGETPQNFDDHSQSREVPKFTSELNNKQIVKPQTSPSSSGIIGFKRDFEELQVPRADFHAKGAFDRKNQKTEKGRQ